MTLYVLTCGKGFDHFSAFGAGESMLRETVLRTALRVVRIIFLIKSVEINCKWMKTAFCTF